MKRWVVLFVLCSLLIPAAAVLRVPPIKVESDPPRSLASPSQKACSSAALAVPAALPAVPAEQRPGD